MDTPIAIRTYTVTLLLCVGCVGPAAARPFLHPTENVSENPQISAHNQVSPQSIAVSDGAVTVVWGEPGPQGNSYELFARRRQAGQWSAVTPVSTADGAFSGDAAVAAASGGETYLAWVDARDGGPQVYAGELDDALQLRWSTRISDADQLVTDPSLVVTPAGELWVAWTALHAGVYEVEWSRRDVRGDWSAPQMVSHDDRRRSSEPELTTGPGGRVHIAWSDRYTGVRLIFHRTYADTAWTAITVMGLDLPAEGKCALPDIAVDQRGLVHTVFQHIVGQESDVYYAAFAPGDTLPPPSERLSAVGAVARVPVIAAAGDGTLHAAWQEEPADTDPESPEIQVVYAQFAELATTERRIISSSEDGRALAPSLVVERRGDAHLVWIAYDIGGGDIFYRRSGLHFAPTGGR